MNPGQLRVTTMDPDTRRLVQLVLDDSDESAGTDEVMDRLLGKNVRPIANSGSRRAAIWLILHKSLKFQLIF